jgi:uncharacterized protein (TIGR02246 family)
MNTDAVDHAHEQWVEAMRSNDADALGRLVADDCILMPPHTVHVHGVKGVVDWFASVVQQVRTERVAIIEREVTRAGDVAVERVAFTWTVVPVTGGPPLEDRGSAVSIWRLQADGSWKMWRNIWNSMLPVAALM